LADGFVPEAQAQLALADAIKDNLYNEIANNPKIAEDITEYMDDQKNLGLTKKDIRELENILEDITPEDNEETGDDDTSGNGNDGSSGKSGEAPGQNKADSGDESPGNSGEAPGQNKEKDNTNDNKFESPEDIPGFGSALDTGKANGQGNGLGLGDIGKIPPGLAKLFGLDVEDDTDDGETIDALPPGQAKKFDVSLAFNDKPDDYFENHFESGIDDHYEINFDGTTKNHGEGKGLYKSVPQKTGIAPGSLNADIKSGGKKPFCAGKGIGGDPVIILNGPAIVILTSLATYNDQGARACDVGNSEITDFIVTGGDISIDGTQPADGPYSITYDVDSQKSGPTRSADTVSRTVLVGEFDPIFEVLDMNNNVETSNFITKIDTTANPPSARIYHLGTIQNSIDDGTIASEVSMDPSGIDNTQPPIVGSPYTVTYRVTDGDSNISDITETIYSCAGSCGESLANAGSDQGFGPAINPTDTVTLDGVSSTTNVIIVSYVWSESNPGAPIPFITNDPNTSTATFEAPSVSGPPGSTEDFTFTLTITDSLGDEYTDDVIIRVTK
jgi:hypothetical protein